MKFDAPELKIKLLVSEAITDDEENDDLPGVSGEID